MLLLCAMILGIGSAWATDVTFAYGDYKGKGTTSSGSEYTMVKTDVSISDTKFFGNNSQAHFYANGKTTITPASGVTITKIELTATSASYNGFQSNGTVTPSTGEVSADADGTTVTWEGSATSAFTIEHNKQIRWTSIVVTYSKSSSGPVDPSVTISETTVAEGGTLTITYPSDLTTISFESNNTSVATVSNIGVVTGVGAGTATITASWDAVANTYNAGSQTFDVTVVQATTYEQVTSTSQLVAGNEYIIVAMENSMAMGAQSNSIRTNVPVTIANNKVAISDEAVAVLTLGGVEGAWTFLASDNSLYLALNSASNAIHTSDDPDANAAKWKISENFELESASISGRVLKYNSGSPRFACYASGQKTAVLFVKSGSATDTKEEPGYYFGALTAEASLGEAFTAPTFSNPNSVTVTFASSNTGVATVDAANGTVTLIGAGTTTISATSEADDTYKAGYASYALTVTDPNGPGTAGNPFTVAEAIAYINTLGSSTSANDVYVSGIVSQVDSYNSDYKSITYWISDDGTTTGQMEVYSGKGLEGADFSAVTDLVFGDIVTVKGKVKMYNTTPEFDKNNQLVSITHSTVTSITVNPTTVSLAANDTEGEFTYTINNPIEGTTLTAASVAEWISNITVGTDKVTFNTTANEGAERAATITLTYGTLTKNVTVTQAKYVADYATLPFSFDGGRADVEEKDGLTQEGLDKDYNSSPKMKFDSAEDCVILKLNEAPRTIEFDIKGNTFSGGTFKVQTSADGETYSDMATYTELGNTETVILYNGNSDVRYIKWVYTVKSSGNVALGNIKVTNTINKHISNAGYATLYVPCALDFSGVSGLTAYTASLSESEVSFSSVANVAANTGVLLKGAEGTYQIPVASSSNNNTSALVGVNVETEVEGAGIFVLMNIDNVVGFYKTTAASFTVGAHTAYFPALSNPSRNFIAIDEATAIKAIESKHQSGEIYNLAGQRVKSAQKGLYIIDGKKVVIK